MQQTRVGARNRLTYDATFQRTMLKHLDDWLPHGHDACVVAQPRDCDNQRQLTLEISSMKYQRAAREGVGTWPLAIHF